MPYSLVWFEPAWAQVHLLVELLGFTPGLPVAFVGAEQPLNLPPPLLVEGFELALMLEDVLPWLAPWDTLEDWSGFACPGGVPPCPAGVPCGLPASAADALSAPINSANPAATSARSFMVASPSEDQTT